MPNSRHMLWSTSTVLLLALAAPPLAPLPGRCKARLRHPRRRHYHRRLMPSTKPAVASAHAAAQCVVAHGQGVVVAAALPLFAISRDAVSEYHRKPAAAAATAAAVAICGKAAVASAVQLLSVLLPMVRVLLSLLALPLGPPA